MEDTQENSPGAPPSPSGNQQRAMDEQFVPQVLPTGLALQPVL